MIELLYTRRYKINFVFSFILSFFLAVIAAGVLSRLHDGSFLAHDLKAFAGVSVFIISNLYFTRKYRRRRKILLTPFQMYVKHTLPDNILLPPVGTCDLKLFLDCNNLLKFIIIIIRNLEEQWDFP